MQDGVKQAASKMAEKTVQDMIEGADYPGLNDIMTRALHAAVMGLAKGASSHITAAVKAQDDLSTRFLANLQSIMYNGPPPKAAMLMAVTKELTDMMASPDWVNMSAGQVSARLARRAAISMASALPVAAALTPLQQRTADRAMGAIKADPTLLLGMAKTNDTVMEAYRASTRGERRTGASLWGFVKQGIDQPDAPPFTWKDKAAVDKSFEVGRWVSDNAKLIDSVAVPAR